MLYEMGYKPRYADPDVFIHTEVSPNGFEYYEYILCYVENTICIPYDTGKSMRMIQEDFKIKYENIEDPGM